MAQYKSILKPNVYLNIEDVADWLAIKEEKYAVPQAEVKSTLEKQNLKFSSKLSGTLGNDISIEYIAAEVGEPISIETLDKEIKVFIHSGVTTELEIKTLFDDHALVEANIIDEEQSVAQNIFPKTKLSGGINDVPFKDGVRELRRLIEKLMNIACDKVESMIQTCVLAKEFVEYHDGNNSNVVVPSKWPVMEVKEVKIDYNRNFGPETVITMSNAMLRGFADRRQAKTDVSLRIIGNDISLRDDNKDTWIGKIFSGSSVGSIKLTYTAGWAKCVDDIPYDLIHATTLLVEYYYFQRSNRDLNISSKGVRGESFSKTKDGIPETIIELIDPYMDHSFPNHEKSQTNVFGI